MDFKASATNSYAFPVACVLACVLQLLIAPQLSVFGGRINFMLVLAVTASFSRTPSIGALLGFLAGLFYDLTSTAPIGLMALCCTIAAWAVANMSRGLPGGVNMEALRLSGVVVVVVNVLYAVVMCVMGVEASPLISICQIGLLSSVLDILVCVPFLALTDAKDASRGFGRLPRSDGTRYKNLH